MNAYEKIQAGMKAKEDAILARLQNNGGVWKRRGPITHATSKVIDRLIAKGIIKFSKEHFGYIMAK